MTSSRVGRPYRYEYVGPLPGSYYDRPDIIKRIRAVSSIVRELHDLAGNPVATAVARRCGTSQPTVWCLLVGRQLPSWQLTRRVARALAAQANPAADWTTYERRLRAAYVKIYDQGDGS